MKDREAILNYSVLPTADDNHSQYHISTQLMESDWSIKLGLFNAALYQEPYEQ